MAIERNMREKRGFDRTNNAIDEINKQNFKTHLEYENYERIVEANRHQRQVDDDFKEVLIREEKNAVLTDDSYLLEQLEKVQHKEIEEVPR